MSDKLNFNTIREDLNSTKSLKIYGQDAVSSLRCKLGEHGDAQEFKSDVAFYEVCFVAERNLTKYELSKKLYAAARQLEWDAPCFQSGIKKEDIQGGQCMNMIPYYYSEKLQSLDIFYEEAEQARMMMNSNSKNLDTKADTTQEGMKSNGELSD